ncbi:MAG: class I SAM-dependent methyltransferase [Chloroflexi bacterium]|nr:class I SAM-dependent methyltransferase [Chloroflexota bacterium]
MYESQAGRGNVRRKPFVSDSYVLTDNRLVYDWKVPLTLPPGRGVCLDVGAGWGRLRGRIEALGYTWVGLDILHDSELTCMGDAERLPFKDCCFDAVYMNEALEHFADPWAAVAEARRVTKPGGLFGGSVAFLTRFHDSYFHFTHWGLEQLLESRGFRLVSIRPGPSMFVTLTHSLLDEGSGLGLAPIIATWLFRPLVATLYGVAKLYTLVRYGRSSESYQRVKAFYSKAPLMFAGDILWLAKKEQ